MSDHLKLLVGVWGDLWQWSTNSQIRYTELSMESMLKQMGNYLKKRKSWNGENFLQWVWFSLNVTFFNKIGIVWKVRFILRYLWLIRWFKYKPNSISIDCCLRWINLNWWLALKGRFSGHKSFTHSIDLVNMKYSRAFFFSFFTPVNS